MTEEPYYDYMSGDEWSYSEGRVIRKGERPCYFMVKPGLEWCRAPKVAVFHRSQTAPVEEYRDWARMEPADFYTASREARGE